MLRRTARAVDGDDECVELSKPRPVMGTKMRATTEIPESTYCKWIVMES